MKSPMFPRGGSARERATPSMLGSAAWQDLGHFGRPRENGCATAYIETKNRSARFTNDDYLRAAQIARPTAAIFVRPRQPLSFQCRVRWPRQQMGEPIQESRRRRVTQRAGCWGRVPVGRMERGRQMLYVEHLKERGLDVRELRGKDLICTCRRGEPCHADVLLHLAIPDGTDWQSGTRPEHMTSLSLEAICRNPRAP